MFLSVETIGPTRAIVLYAEGHALVVAVAGPVRARSDGQVIGYVSVGYELTAVQSFVSSFDADENTVFTVTDQRGVILATPDMQPGLVSVSDDEAVRLALRGQSGALSAPGPSGDHLVGYAPVGDLGWTVTARVPTSEALKSLGPVRAAVLGIATIVCAILVGLLLIAARLWRHRIQDQIALEAAVTELARSNDDLAQFAYLASHDLAEPLRAISGPISLVAKRYRGQLDPDTDRFIDFAVDGCDRMQQLIDGLLAYSRVGRIEGDATATDCNDLVADVLADLGPTIEEAGAVITSAELPTVMAEPNQLTQVFRNLVSNALKFAPSGTAPVIDIAAGRADAQWRFTVTDNGIGIDPQHRERIFGMFKRLHGRDEYPGTGLGLAMAKKIVERHGGSIGVEDSPNGPGSRFWFTVTAVPK